jgi:adhesin transport system membrane fusion protein
MLNISNRKIPADWAAEEFQALRTMNTAKSGRVLARWLLGIMLLLVCCLFLPWQQNIPGKGKLTALDPAQRPQQIHTAIAGRITGWKVKEGQFVNKGDTIVTLAEIKDDYFDPELIKRLEEQLFAKESSIKATEDQVVAIGKQLNALEAGLKFTLQKSRNKVKQNRLKVFSDSTDFENEKVQYDFSLKQYDRFKSLYEKDGLISLTDLERRTQKLQETMAKKISTQNKFFVSKNEYLNSLIELSSVEAEYSDKISKANAELGAKKSYLADAQAEYSKLRNKIVNVEMRTQNYALVAPQDGYIVKALKVGIGETVKETDALVTIMPDAANLAVELYVKAMDVPLIQKGRHVRIQFDGWPVLNFTGWPNVSVGTFGGEVAVIDYVASSGGDYRLLVVPDKSDEIWPEQLRLGSGANGWVMLNDVSIWFELWRQINGFPPTIDQSEANQDMTKGDKK